jgi:hypothetical protein
LSGWTVAATFDHDDPAMSRGAGRLLSTTKVVVFRVYVNLGEGSIIMFVTITIVAFIVLFVDI